MDRHRIISKKKTGYISGIQRTKDGDIDWSKELPSTCHLSRCAVSNDYYNGHDADTFTGEIPVFGVMACCTRLWIGG